MLTGMVLHTMIILSCRSATGDGRSAVSCRVSSPLQALLKDSLARALSRRELYNKHHSKVNTQ